MRRAFAAAVLILAASSITVSADPIEDDAFPALITGTVTFPCFGCDPQSDGDFAGTYVSISGATRAVTGTWAEFPISDSLTDLVGTCHSRYGIAVLQYAGESFSHTFYWSRLAAAVVIQEQTQRGAGTFVLDPGSACGRAASATVNLAIRVVDYLGPCCLRP